nr:murein L,D-transpeptidase catalytic domain family protein [uncultured Flavobacterium sp.]
MKTALLPIVLIGTFLIGPLNMNLSINLNNENGGGKKKVVTKKIVPNSSKEIASLTKKDFKIENIDHMILTKYLDLDEKKFEKPKIQSFDSAFKGYYKLKSEGKIDKEILTIIDFTQSSTEKRMWVIDMVKNEIIFQTVVSHGRNSGLEYATNFSNTPESHKSSLGFYKTAETYYGANGYSLRLDGLEKGINDNARSRAIVIHGADYADENLANNQGYLGRSYGCPALPLSNYKEIIDFIKDESCLFIYHDSDPAYLKKSTLLN